MIKATHPRIDTGGGNALAEHCVSEDRDSAEDYDAHSRRSIYPHLRARLRNLHSGRHCYCDMHVRFPHHIGKPVVLLRKHYELNKLACLEWRFRHLHSRSWKWFSYYERNLGRWISKLRIRSYKWRWKYHDHAYSNRYGLSSNQRSRGSWRGFRSIGRHGEHIGGSRSDMRQQ